jgi:hypothetical protein
MSQEGYWSALQRRGIARRRLLQAAGAGAAITGFGLVACGRPNSQSSSSTASSGTPKSGGIARLRVTNDPFDWDMSFAGKSIPNDYGQDLAYDSLLAFKHGPGIDFGASILQPNLAEKWETPDAITYTFHLRQGVKFANLPPVNGRELTSADIKWSYEYWSRTGQFKDKQLPPSQYASYFEGITGIQTPDPYTVVVTFAQRTSTRLFRTKSSTRMAICRRVSLEPDPGNWTRHHRKKARDGFGRRIRTTGTAASRTSTKSTGSLSLTRPPPTAPSKPGRLTSWESRATTWQSFPLSNSSRPTQPRFTPNTSLSAAHSTSISTRKKRR